MGAGGVIVLIHAVYRLERFWRSWSEDFLEAWRMIVNFITHRPFIAMVIAFHAMFIAWIISSNVYWFLRDAVLSLFP